ncbi:MAG: DUF368 domain-containing protein [Sarcina sp.]
MYVINFIRGFFMALADSVPGVSGGTIAFILGFYDKFIDSLNSLTSKGDKEKKKESIIFLFKLGIGWVVGMVLSVIFLSSIFESHIYAISSVFTGFIIFSIPLIIRAEKNTIINKYHNLIFSVIGVIIVVAISYFNPSSSGEGINLAVSSLTIGTIIYVFICGMIAISAMVLPGISGSTLLLIFGLYVPIISAIKSVLKLDLQYVPILAVFGIGVIIGIVSTIKLIKYSLANYRAQMIYLILGLMVGSIYAVFMGPTTLENPLPAMNLTSFNYIYFILGGALILGLDKLQDILKQKQNK